MKVSDTFSVENPGVISSNTVDTFLPNEPCKIKSFTVIKVRRCKISAASESPLFTLWVSRYNSTKQSPSSQSTVDHKSRPTGRTIHVKGLPAFVTKASLYRIFGSSKGKELEIDVITILPTDKEALEPIDNALKKSHSHYLGYQHAYIAYFEESSVDTVLDMPHMSEQYYFLPSNHNQMSLVWSNALDNPYIFNYAKRLEHYTNFMKGYDMGVEETEQQNRMEATEADEDGWIKPKRRASRAWKADRPTGNPMEFLSERSGRNKKKRKEPLVHFYRNQVKDEKVEKIRELQAKFNEDRKKIQEMRQQRKFRPY